MTLTVTPIKLPPNGNPGTVPPWLVHPNPDLPHILVPSNVRVVSGVVGSSTGKGI